MAFTFEFIDNAAIDPKTRKAIRSHVMKGKNVGKVRQPHRGRRAKGAPKHQLLANSDVVQSRKDGRGGKDGRKKPDLTAIRDVFLHADADGVGSSFPCTLTASSKRFMHQYTQFMADAIYPPELCTNPDVQNSIWFRYLPEDETYFYCFMALATACIDYSAGKETSWQKDQHHLATALALVNKTLSGADAVSDTAIAGVALLCIFSGIREESPHTRHHFEGLVRMIKVRGGLQALKHNPPLIEKAHRIDIDLALEQGRCVRFERDNTTPAVVVAQCAKVTPPNYAHLQEAIKNLDSDIISATDEIMRLSTLINSTAFTSKLDPFFFQDLIMNFFYRLLRTNPISASKSYKSLDPVGHTLHLGLIMFMKTLIIQFGRQRRIRYRLLTAAYLAALDEVVFLKFIDPATLVWLLFIGDVGVLDESDKPWLLARLIAPISQLQITSWTELKALLHRYPWIDVIHDRRAGQTWNDLLAHQEKNDSPESKPSTL